MRKLKNVDFRSKVVKNVDFMLTRDNLENSKCEFHATCKHEMLISGQKG